MKLLFIFILLFTSSVFGAPLNCGKTGMVVYTEGKAPSCAARIMPEESEYLCFPLSESPTQKWIDSFTGPLSQKEQPWWAAQGKLLFPNVNYPGAWSYPGIEAKYYPGEGEIFAAKPNVYIESIHDEKKFKFEFSAEYKINFLATTPVLENDVWKGKVVERDKFEVDDVFYDYLFYDVRLPKDMMQFERGVCTTRESAIEWMLKDLKEMKYSALALQDFEEHWRAKIPDYPFYCIYPQYNRELDEALKVNIELEQSVFIRSLYVLIPHKKTPDIEEAQEVPLPSQDPSEFRPEVKIQRENMFREWGVAFFGH